jgi:hypothetical protein
MASLRAKSVNKRLRPARDEDFHAWLLKQAATLRRGALMAADTEAIAEELETMAARERHELKSHVKILLAHLLKWTWQDDGRELHGNSWRKSIRNARQEISDLLADSPSLKPRVAEFLPEAYERARADASDDSGLPIDTFPASCPWDFVQLMDHDFWPEPHLG